MAGSYGINADKTTQPRRKDYHRITAGHQCLVWRAGAAPRSHKIQTFFDAAQECCLILSCRTSLDFRRNSAWGHDSGKIVMRFYICTTRCYSER